MTGNDEVVVTRMVVDGARPPVGWEKAKIDENATKVGGVIGDNSSSNGRQGWSQNIGLNKGKLFGTRFGSVRSVTGR